MANSGTGARIKVWPGIQTSFQALLNGGGGSGYVKNVTYQGVSNDNVDYAIQINQLSYFLMCGVVLCLSGLTFWMRTIDATARVMTRCVRCIR